MLEVENESVSPAFVVLEAIEPNQCRTGVPAESQTSTALTVTAGMFV
jgi:hypothetical protein